MQARWNSFGGMYPMTPQKLIEYRGNVYHYKGYLEIIKLTLLDQSPYKLKFFCQMIKPSCSLAALGSHQHQTRWESWSGKYLRRTWYSTDDPTLAFNNNVQGLNMPSTRRGEFILVEGYSVRSGNLPTIFSRSLVAIPSRTWDSFRIFNNASRCISDVINRDNIEICVDCFFNRSTTEYSLLLRVLMNLRWPPCWPTSSFVVP